MSSSESAESREDPSVSEEAGEKIIDERGQVSTVERINTKNTAEHAIHSSSSEEICDDEDSREDDDIETWTGLDDYSLLK